MLLATDGQRVQGITISVLALERLESETSPSTGFGLLKKISRSLLAAELNEALRLF